MSNIIVIDMQNIFTYGKRYYMKRPIIFSDFLWVTNFGKLQVAKGERFYGQK